MAASPSPEYFVLSAGGTMIVIDAPEGGRARIVYAGPDLGEADPAQLDELAKRGHAPGGPEAPIAPSLLNALGTGHPSPPGLLAHTDGLNWALDPRVTSTAQSYDDTLSITLRDKQSGVELHHDITLDAQSGAARFAVSLRNAGNGPVTLDWLSAICLPLDPRLNRITSFSGKWAGEFQTEQHDLPRGGFLRESRAGRPGHASYPGLYLGTATTSESAGQACALHLAASGNHRLRVDRTGEGSMIAQAGELLGPGEVILGSGEDYTAPQMIALWSGAGYGDLTRRLHSYVRASLANPDAPRPVHYNTWEAVYFDHSPEKLMALADQAAEVGAERFVLDDGWFGARRSDRAGLGDWYVSQEVYPDGLKPLADHVRSLGMEFGLWFEPEMVNPDSDLYRAHPDWVLGAPGVAPIPSRHQLPLDLTRPEVCDYLFERIDTLTSELGIAYIKWDMNRDIQHPGDANGRAVTHRQTAALYGLLRRIRAAHPDLVIESCSSGGARADYGILSLTDRIWTSDNNDARGRYAIMRGAAHFLPLAVLGNHVGPKRCHITGRRFDMAFRAGTAIFGHMGMELDLAQESESARAVLAAAIALHKLHRALIHQGEYHRLETPPHIAGTGCVSDDRAQALFQIAILDQHPDAHPPRIHFAGLAPDARYNLSCLWPQVMAKPIGLYTGAMLMQHGLQLPLTHPDTCLIYHLEASE